MRSQPLRLTRQDAFSRAKQLYLSGNYEVALVWYHRAHRLRPKAKDVQIAIHMCEDAIANSTGSVKTMFFRI